MDLPNLFSNTSQIDERYLLCTVLTDTTIQSLLLKISAGNTKVVCHSPIYPYTDETTAVMKMDESLQELGEESENVSDILFALEQSWMKSGGIVSSKKSLLHKIVTDLSLRPVGFVVQSEALIQHSINHNPHFSAIILLLSQASVTVSIVSQGKVVSTQSVGRSSDTISDLREAFARYLKEKGEAHLPGKLICASFALSEAELVDAQQKLLDAEWGAEIPFVQTPTIDVIKPDLASAIIAQQAGEAVQTTAATVAAAEPVEEAEDFGFTSVSPSQETKSDMTEHENLTAVDPTVAAPTSFGIPIKQNSLPVLNDDSTETAVDLDAPDEAPKKSFFSTLIPKTVTTSSGKKYNPRPFIAAGAVAGVVAIVIGVYIWFSYFTHVIVQIKPVSKAVTKEVVLTLDPESTEPDVATLHIPAQKVILELTKEGEGQTTGIKIVGEKAKGTAVIYNNTEAQKSFPAGTVLASGKIQFVTDKEVTVPAAKVNIISPTKKEVTASEAKVDVTAYVIGAEGNIAKDTELSVGDFDKSTYIAKSDAVFAGGSSREIRVVSKEDRELLLSEVKAELLAEAQEKFKEQSGNGTYIIPTKDLVITKTVYSAETEATTESLGVTVSGTVTALSYTVEDLVPIAQAILGDQVPAGYSLSSENPQILSAPAEAAKNSTAITLTANISAQAVPNFDTNSLTSELVSRSLEDAREHLIKKQTISEVEFFFNPPIAKKFATSLPKKQAQITIQEK